MKLSKTQVASAVGGALLLVGTAVQAQALTVQLYGQVNRALMWADDETQSKWFHVDGQPSSTRFGIRGTSQVMPGLRAGAQIETEMKSNPSDTVSFGNASTGALSGGAVGFAERWLDLYFEGGWGKINIGQGSGAADDASTIDLSGTGLANGSCACDWGGGIEWRGAAGGLGVTLADTLNNNDFESRHDRVMYSTPTFGGFRAQAGFGQKSDHGETTEASLWYSGKLAGTLQAAIGWSTENLPGFNNETIGGSIGWLHTSGINVSFNYTQSDVAATRDATYYFTKVGYKFGRHAISVAYSLNEDQAAVGDETKGWGLGYVWSPTGWAEIYAGYHLFTLERATGSANDITVAAIGSRIRF